MPEYTEARAGFDVSELMWILESTRKTTPTSGAWNHLGDGLSLSPAGARNWRERIGLGRQIAKGFTLIKKWFEPVIEYDILHKDAGNNYEWGENLAAALGTDVAESTIDLEKRIMYRSIGAKLDLPTGSDDEYWWFKGCKCNEFELSGAQDETVKIREALIALVGLYGTTDYVSGTATRETFPTTEPIVNGDCDLLIKPSGGSLTSIMPDVLSWRMRIRRNLERHGSDSGDGTLYDKALESKMELELEITMDFVNKTQLNQYLNATKIFAQLKVPNSTGGRQIGLSASGSEQGVFRTMTKPARELDLINLTITGAFDTIAVSTI